VTKPSDVERLAHELHEYVRFRAAKEGVGYALSPGFFCDALKKGCDNFFGVQVGASCCGMISSPNFLRNGKAARCCIEKRETWKSKAGGRRRRRLPLSKRAYISA
jgi:hypothetical protein